MSKILTINIYPEMISPNADRESLQLQLINELVLPIVAGKGFPLQLLVYYY